MNPSVLILIAALVAAPVYAEKKPKESGFQKVLRSMFPSAKPKVVPKKRKRVIRSVKPSPVPIAKPEISKRIYVPVEVDWMAQYWEQEAAWDYYIPEDEQIRFIDGKYQVPIVVYRHYEDMAKTPRRTPAPKPFNPLRNEG